MIVERMSSSSGEGDFCQLLETTEVIMSLCRWGGGQVVFFGFLFEIHFLSDVLIFTILLILHQVEFKL